MAIYLDLGQYDEVMEFYKKAQEVNPDAPESWYLFQHLGRLYYTTGRYEDALTAFQEKCKIMRIDPIEDQHIGITYGFMGDRKKAEQVVKNLEKRKAFISIAYIYSALGDNNRAFEYMEKAYKNRTPENWNLVMLRADPEFKKIRSDPRYKALLKKVGLPE
ncbi:MAG: tetratricopeptide repeat protein, partial [Candidatus Latescibacter sp.]|nr:tetratricopeptide repeat protein [Candidatus Latescibacter sp.]